jgi:transposase
MKKDTRRVGLDFHGETIAVAVAEESGEVRSMGTVANRPDAIRALVKRLGSPQTLRACYEAGGPRRGTSCTGSSPDWA